MTWRRVALTALIVVGGLYLAIWSFRIRLGLITPTANLRYFYYGEEPCTLSDSALYWIFWPPYKVSLRIQTSQDDRYLIHWSDRDGGRGFEHLCRRGRRLGV